MAGNVRISILAIATITTASEPMNHSNDTHSMAIGYILPRLNGQVSEINQRGMLVGR